MNIPDFNLPSLWDAYRQKDFNAVVQKIMEIVRHFDRMCYVALTREEHRYFDDCIFTIFGIFTQPDFQPPPEFAYIFVNINHLLVNMVAASSFGSVQPFLDRVAYQENNYVKILSLLTCHSPCHIDFEKFFEINADLASLWWFNYQTAANGTLSKDVYDRVVTHLKSIPKQFKVQDLRSAPLYFQCSYYSPETDRLIKTKINNDLRVKTAGMKIHNTPRKKSIAIFCDRWQPTTAVYKSSYHQIEKLAHKYDLTLVYYTKDKNELTDTKLFKSVRRVTISPDLRTLDFSEIKYNDFQLAYFPDIGMNYESVCLSNMKVAPIMVTGYGHPVSTFGSRVNYFIGGLDSELPEKAEENYSERLVLIPGIGAHPVFPNYKRKFPKTDKFLINCCWTTPKINYPMLDALRQIQNRASRPVHYQFFPSWTVNRYQAAISFLEQMTKFFNGNVTVYLDTPYQEYLSLLENGQFSLDSYPFGGYNTVVDSLFVGCPTVTIEKDRFFNRASSALMRKVGITDLITHSIEEYIETTLELIDHHDKLDSLRQDLAAKDLKTLLVDTNEPIYFAKAIDYIIENHETLKTGSEPIIMA
jgi:hypothetical protein